MEEKMVRAFHLDETILIEDAEMLPRKLTLLDGSLPFGLYRITATVKVFRAEEED